MLSKGKVENKFVCGIINAKICHNGWEYSSEIPEYSWSFLMAFDVFCKHSSSSVAFPFS